MKIVILPEAEQDLLDGVRFYESRDLGVGGHFLECLLALHQFAGVHARELGYHQMFAKRFPFAIYYRIENDRILVHAVLDCRRNPAWVRQRLSQP